MSAVEGQALSQAPRWDPTTCVVGTRHDDASWAFDLRGFPARTDDRGFALVPAEDAAASTFRITLHAG